jgi:hypothetical protein
MRRCKFSAKTAKGPDGPPFEKGRGREGPLAIPSVPRRAAATAGCRLAMGVSRSIPDAVSRDALFPLLPALFATYIPIMDGFVLTLLLLAMAATLGILLLGVFSMARGGEFNKRNANRFMRLRVIFQGIAVVLFIIFMMVWHRG